MVWRGVVGTRALAWAEVGRDAVLRGEPVSDGLPHVYADCARPVSGFPAFACGRRNALAAGRHLEEDRSRPLPARPQEVLVDPVVGDLEPTSDGGVGMSRYVNIYTPWKGSRLANVNHRMLGYGNT